jgi:hypothetical protein
MDEAEIAVNERIDKLFEQALEEFKAENKYATIIVPNPLKEKFAQLIVRECVAICQDTDGEEDDMAKCGRQDCAVEIREHFGVEL